MEIIESLLAVVEGEAEVQLPKCAGNYWVDSLWAEAARPIASGFVGWRFGFPPAGSED